MSEPSTHKAKRFGNLAHFMILSEAKLGLKQENPPHTFAFYITERVIKYFLSQFLGVGVSTNNLNLSGGGGWWKSTVSGGGGCWKLTVSGGGGWSKNFAAPPPCGQFLEQPLPKTHEILEGYSMCKGVICVDISRVLDAGLYFHKWAKRTRENMTGSQNEWNINEYNTLTHNIALISQFNNI